jgi:septum formation protein
MEQARLVLASSSPRRREILTRLGLEHRVVCPQVDETRLSGETVEVFPRRVAHEKARDGAARLGPEVAATAWVIGADTVVVRDGEPLGKPEDAGEAYQMLASLSGRDHLVLTGWAILGPDGSERGGVESTMVRFKELHPAEIDAYVASGEPLDKAGAYGIQGLGCFLVERIEGNYENVVGLPACPLIRALLDLGAIEEFPVARRSAR